MSRAGIGDAAKLIAKHCEYSYRGQTLTGPPIIDAFIESHVRAAHDLDSIEYLSGSCKEVTSEGVIISVADKISLNGKTHIYNDRLLVRMEPNGAEWNIVCLKHLPISAERDQLRDFLTSAGPKRA